jgi:hypothetical protein
MAWVRREPVQMTALSSDQATDEHRPSSLLRHKWLILGFALLLPHIIPAVSVHQAAWVLGATFFWKEEGKGSRTVTSNASNHSSQLMTEGRSRKALIVRSGTILWMAGH